MTEPARSHSHAANVRADDGQPRQLIHAWLTPVRFDESAAQGVFFAGAALAAALIAGSLLSWPAAHVYAAGVVISGTLIAIYVLFRVVPPPGASAAETIDPIELVAVPTEVTSAVACALLWPTSGCGLARLAVEEGL